MRGDDRDPPVYGEGMRPLLTCVLIVGLAGCSLFESDPEPEAAAAPAAASDGSDPLAPPPSASQSQPAPTQRSAPPAFEPIQPVPAPASDGGAAEPDPVAPGSTLGPSAPGPTPGPSAPGPRPATPTPAAPPPSAGPVSPDAGGRVTLIADELGVRLALQMLADLAGARLDVSPWVQGTVTVHLVDVPFRRAVERLLVHVGEFELIGQGDLLQVVPRPFVTSGAVVSVEGDRLTVRPDQGPDVVLEPVVAPNGAQDSATALQLRTQLGRLVPGQRVAVSSVALGGQHYLTSLAARTPDASLQPAPAPATEAEAWQPTQAEDFPPVVVPPSGQ